MLFCFECLKAEEETEDWGAINHSSPATALFVFFSCEISIGIIVFSLRCWFSPATMERTTPVRKPHTSTADLLTWSETPPSDSPAPGSAASRSAPRSHQVLILLLILLKSESILSPFLFLLFFLPFILLSFLGYWSWLNLGDWLIWLFFLFSSLLAFRWDP